LTIEQMGLVPETSRHEIGPGQHEICFAYSDVIAAADNQTTFKMAVESIAAKNGLAANFMPKPLENRIGNALHINLSLEQNGNNLFTYPELSEEVRRFMAGVLYRTREITAFLNPLPNSYRRLGNPMAPKYVCWAPVNRSQLVRVPAATGKYARMELRSPDPMCNHYLALALVLAAGLEGIRENRPLQEATPFDVYTASQNKVSGLARLPPTLEEAIGLAEDSAFAKTVLGPEVVDAYVRTIRPGVAAAAAESAAAPG
jgi:glutamine synthetase